MKFFFQRITNIYLLTNFQPPKSKMVKLKEQHEQAVRMKVFSMLAEQKGSNFIQKDEITIVKVQADLSSPKLEIMFNYSYPIDQRSGQSIICRRAELPTIRISLKFQHKSPKQIYENLKIKIFLAEFIQNQEQSYYKIVPEGLSGKTCHDVDEYQVFAFTGIRIAKTSKQTSVTHLLVGLYNEIKGNKTWLDLFFSKPLFVTQNSNAILIDSQDTVGRYFDQFGIQNMSLSRRLKIFATEEEEANELQLRFTSHLPKLFNIIYLAYKFTRTCQLYFRKEPLDVQNVKNSFKPSKQLNLPPKLLQHYKNIIGMILAAKNYFEGISEPLDSSKLVCNYLNPKANIILRIIYPLRKVRFIFAEEFTKHFQIVNGDGYDLTPFRKMQPSEAKTVYRLYLDTIKQIDSYNDFKEQAYQQLKSQSLKSENSSNDQREQWKNQLKKNINPPRTRSRVHNLSNSRENQESQSYQNQIEQPVEAPPSTKKRSYFSDMKKIVEQSKKERLQEKKREKDHDAIFKEVIMQKKESECIKNIATDIIPHSQTKSNQTSSSRKLSFLKAYQITYSSKNCSCTTILEINDSLFINKTLIPFQHETFSPYNQPYTCGRHHFRQHRFNSNESSNDLRSPFSHTPQRSRNYHFTQFDRDERSQNERSSSQKSRIQSKFERQRQILKHHK